MSLEQRRPLTLHVVESHLGPGPPDGEVTTVRGEHGPFTLGRLGIERGDQPTLAVPEARLGVRCERHDACARGIHVDPFDVGFLLAKTRDCLPVPCPDLRAPAQREREEAISVGGGDDLGDLTGVALENRHGRILAPSCPIEIPDASGPVHRSGHDLRPVLGERGVVHRRTVAAQGGHPVARLGPEAHVAVQPRRQDLFTIRCEESKQGLLAVRREGRGRARRGRGYPHGGRWQAVGACAAMAAGHGVAPARCKREEGDRQDESGLATRHGVAASARRIVSEGVEDVADHRGVGEVVAVPPRCSKHGVDLAVTDQPQSGYRHGAV